MRRRPWSHGCATFGLVVAWSSLALAAPVAKSAIDDAVCDDDARAGPWNGAWAITFGVAAVASAGVATFAPAPWFSSDTRAGLYVTAAKASVGVVAKLVQPLELDVRNLCDDRRPASSTTSTKYALLDEVARRENRVLLTNVVGGVLLNAVGLLYLGYGRGAWETAWTSFGIGSAVAVASALTAPTHAWLLKRRLRVAAVPQLGQPGLALVAVW